MQWTTSVFFFQTKLGALFLCLHQAGSVLVTDLKFIRAVIQLSFHTVVLTANIYTVISGTSFSTELHRLPFFIPPFCSTNPQGILTRRRRFQLSGPMLEVLSNSGFCFLRISVIKTRNVATQKTH